MAAAPAAPAGVGAPALTAATRLIPDRSPRAGSGAPAPAAPVGSRGRSLPRAGAAQARRRLPAPRTGRPRHRPRRRPSSPGRSNRRHRGARSPSSAAAPGRRPVAAPRGAVRSGSVDADGGGAGGRAGGAERRRGGRRHCSSLTSSGGGSSASSTNSSAASNAPTTTRQGASPRCGHAVVASPSRCSTAPRPPAWRTAWRSSSPAAATSRERWPLPPTRRGPRPWWPTCPVTDGRDRGRHGTEARVRIGAAARPEHAGRGLPAAGRLHVGRRGHGRLGPREHPVALADL